MNPDEITKQIMQGARKKSDGIHLTESNTFRHKGKTSYKSYSKRNERDNKALQERLKAQKPKPIGRPKVKIIADANHNLIFTDSKS